ncbi:YslB family protein [Periweissella beninensis]|uniref:YslB family protein n=1 Tax=Periweissella beninensis TaxID=504936 RepID=UPI0021A9669C|nr:YslB family protein [Periweissella beninensis]MCT4396228.1 DUF2507 domain-containing protein [Periweissella beninensis]
MNNDIYKQLVASPSQPSPFALSVLRDSLIPDILQEDTASILYWAGKNLARQYSLSNMDDIIIFFLNAGFGELTLTKQTNHQLSWNLAGSFVDNRFLASKTPDFNLEAGFLAQQLEQMLEKVAEANFVINKRKHLITINVQVEAKTDLTISNLA